MGELDGRVCTICETWKSRQEMAKNSSRAGGGMNSWCKNCKNKKSKELREKRKSKELCICCGQPRIDESIFCAVHLIKNRIWNKNLIDTHKIKGLCIACNQPHVDNSIYCALHLIRNKASNKNFKDVHKAEGLCHECGQTVGGGVYCSKCKIFTNFSSIIRLTLLKGGKSKNLKSWITFVDYTKEDLIHHIDHWKDIQGLNGDFMEIHHILHRSESPWQEPGDPEWRKLWSLSNLLPLTRSSHNAVHRGDYSGLHPEVRGHILKMREVDER